MESKLVFTDERFPDIEIWNYGRVMFNVVEIGGPSHLQESYCFNHYEDKTTYDVSPEFAEKVAKDHFDQMASDG
tara:strand:+ start:277 stop:498 length:222 start_codon:yes stop_codon:yes gene_type:complete